MIDSIQVELGQVISIKTINVLKEQLDDVLEQKKSVVLLSNNVDQVDTAAVQLLVAFNEKLKSNGFTLSWEQPSEEVCSVVALLGLEKAVSL